ncbi:MAG: tRNA (N(6)-L-threonylcarbamoyladenosine(37)-C(2))-methylthiotransferase [Candidatus Hodarchaeales archaeon]
MTSTHQKEQNEERFSFYLETYGCAANQADSEKMKGLLLANGGMSTSLERADLVIINSCGVKGPTEDKIIKRASDLLLAGHELVMAGCLPRISLEKIEKLCPDHAALVDTRSIHLIVDAVRRVLAGERKMRVFSDLKAVKAKSKLELPLPAGTSGIVQISEGCTGHCSYCATKFARGGQLSFPPADILAAVTLLVQQHGCKDIWLTAQDTGSYCWNGTRLPELVKRVIMANHGWKFHLRVGMMNPDQLELFVDDHANLMIKEKSLYRFVHVPVQSGSDSILEVMKRMYNVETVKRTIQRLKKKVPQLTISTDIICGFPGETEEDFIGSLELVRWLRPDIVNVTRFWPRPGTRATKLPRLPVKLVKKRTKEIVTLSREIAMERNREWIDWEGESLVTEKGKNDTSVLRNGYYKPVIIEKKLVPGQFTRVRIIGATSFYLLGEVIK